MCAQTVHGAVQLVLDRFPLDLDEPGVGEPLEQQKGAPRAERRQLCRLCVKYAPQCSTVRTNGLKMP